MEETKGTITSASSKMISITMVLACIILGPQPVNGANILLLPSPYPGHMNYFEALGEILISRGHDVHMLVPMGLPRLDKYRETGMVMQTYDVPTGWSKHVDEAFDGHLEDCINNPDNMMHHIHQLSMLFSLQCEYALTDQNILEKIKSSKFDLAVNDGVLFSHCLYLIPKHLGIPFISMTSLYFPLHMNVPPTVLVFIPEIFAPNLRLVTFRERLHNAYIHISRHFYFASQTFSEKVRTLYGNSLATSFSNLPRESLLWLLNTHPILDVAHPTMPHVIHVGGIAVRPPQGLSIELDTFFRDSAHGVIVVSLGTMGTGLKISFCQKLISAFSQLKQRILWKFENRQNLSLPENIMIKHWIPQRDVLAHPKTRVFVTHCGTNGFTEAISSQVPMVGLPIHANQFHNARVIVEKQYGVIISLRNFTSKDLMDAINGVLDNKTIANAVSKAGQILNDQLDNPRDLAAFWIEHVIKYGGEHLRSYSQDMEWYKLLMVDILLLFVIMIGCLSFISYKIVNNIYNMYKACDLSLNF